MSILEACKTSLCSFDSLNERHQSSYILLFCSNPHSHFLLESAQKQFPTIVEHNS